MKNYRFLMFVLAFLVASSPVAAFLRLHAAALLAFDICLHVLVSAAFQLLHATVSCCCSAGFLLLFLHVMFLFCCFSHACLLFPLVALPPLMLCCWLSAAIAVSSTAGFGSLYSFLQLPAVCCFLKSFHHHVPSNFSAGMTLLCRLDRSALKSVSDSNRTR